MHLKLVSIAAGVVALGAAAWFVLPVDRAHAQPQVNVSGCSCSPPTSLPDKTNPLLSVYHCVCPGMQCVITSAAKPSGTSEFALEQACAGPSGGGSTVILPSR